MPILDLPSSSVHFTESGKGKPLLLLHANPGDSLDFEAVIPELAKQYRVLALDWPGYGGSAQPSSDRVVCVLYFYQVLMEFLDALKLPPALFIGNSLGGNVAARLAILAPERVLGLVLVSSGGFTAHNLATRAFCALQGSRFAFSPRFFAGLYLRRRNPVVMAMLKRAATSQATATRRALNRAVWRSFLDPMNDLRESAGRIKAPTLLIFGRYDPVISAKHDGRIASKSIPEARLVVMPSGHAPFAEIPEAFLEKALPFLARCVRA